MRSSLATALDEFMRSTRNLSGIGHNDVNNAGVFTAISNDTSELFGGQSAQAFDNTPPATTVTITYDGGKSPVGSQQFVRGLVTITVDATDATGVASTTVSIGGSPLTPVQGSIASHYVVTYDSRSANGGVGDGAVSLTVSSVDTLQNRGSRTVGIVVDNTPPSINASAPSSSVYYTGSVPFMATASDGAGSGLASLTVAGFAGITNTGAPPASFQAVWAVPAGTYDGPVAGTQYQACDAVGNCSTVPLTVNIDQTPPTVSFDSGPTGFTAETSATVRVHVTDAGAGVGGVFGRVGPTVSNGVAVSGAPGYYDVPFMLTSGRNVLTVWAVDGSQNAMGLAPNSGDGRGSPYALSTSLVYTRRTLTLSLDGGFRSYVDERGASINSAGQYTFPSSTKQSVVDGGSIYKLVTRAGWTSQPSAADLEAGNTYNIPVMRFTVPYDAVNQAPITSASATVQVPGYPPVSLDLWPSSSPPDGTAAFLLPLSSSLIPTLAQITSSKALAIAVSMADAAGNTGSGTWAVTYNPVGPPIALTQDTQYPAAAVSDARTVYYYRPGSSLYTNLWTLAPFSQDGGVRLLHFVAANPSLLPVAVRLGLPNGMWNVQENWSGGSDADSPTLTYDGACVAGSPSSASPCRTSLIMYSSYWPGSTGSALACASSGHNSIPSAAGFTSQTGALAVRVYQSNGSPATALSSGRYVIPPSSQLDVYVVRPVYTSRSNWPALNWSSSHGAFTSTVEVSYTAKTRSITCSIPGGSSGGSFERDTWTGTTWIRSLSSGAENYSGVLTPYTVGYDGSAETGVETSYPTITITGSYAR
jgi:hypothetical protein